MTKKRVDPLKDKREINEEHRTKKNNKHNRTETLEQKKGGGSGHCIKAHLHLTHTMPTRDEMHHA